MHPKHIKDTQRSNEWSVLRIMSDFVKGFDELHDRVPCNVLLLLIQLVENRRFTVKVKHQVEQMRTAKNRLPGINLRIENGVLANNLNLMYLRLGFLQGKPKVSNSSIGRQLQL